MNFSLSNQAAKVLAYVMREQRLWLLGDVVSRRHSLEVFFKWIDNSPHLKLDRLYQFWLKLTSSVN